MDLKTVGYPLDMTGYTELAYINIEDSSTLNDTTDLFDSLIDTNLALDSKLEPLDNPVLKPSKCNIDFSAAFDFSIKYPGYDFGPPNPDKRLFREIDNFSLAISSLNNTLISMLLDLDCCEMSTKYNKTMVPFFRWLADNPSVNSCGDNPNLNIGDCSFNNSDNFISTILKIVKSINDVYVVIEPIFCLVKPIPGNPWMPVSWDWLKIVRGYLEKYEYFSDTIMSGSYIKEYMTDNVVALDRSIQNCVMGSDSFIKTTIDTKDIIREVPTNNQDTLDKIAELKKEINDINSKLNDKEELTWIDRQSLLTQLDFNTNEIKNLELVIINTDGTSYTKSIENKLKLYQKKKASNSICECFREVLDLNALLLLPRIPKTSINYFPIDTFDANSNKNPFLNLKNETAYSIFYKDIYTNELKEIPGVKNKRIFFSDNIITDLDFINKFFTFAQKETPYKNYNKLDFDKLNNYINQGPINTDFDWLDNIKSYFLYEDDLRYIMDNDLDFFISNNGQLTIEINDSLNTINNHNKNIIDTIDKYQLYERNLYSKLENLNKTSFDNYKAFYENAITSLNNIKSKNEQYKNIVINYIVSQMEYILSNHFGSYTDEDYIKDILDKKINSSLDDIFKFLVLFPGNSSDSIVNEVLLEAKNILYNAINYIQQRKILFGKFAMRSYNNYLNNLINRLNTDFNNYKLLSDRYSIYLNNKINNIENESLNDILNDYYLIKDNLIYSWIIDSLPFLEKTSRIENSIENISYLTLLPEIDGAYILNNFKKEYTFSGGYIYFAIEINNASIVPADFSFGFDSINYISNFITQEKNDSEVVRIRDTILRLERSKILLFKTLENNTVYEFHLADTPNIPCDCNIVCEVIQMIVKYITGLIRELLKRLMLILIDYLVPEWMKSLIRLVLAKIRCITGLIYTKERLDNIDDFYHSLMDSLKNRINLYPYDSCLSKVLDNITDTNDITNLITGDANISDSFEHHLDIEFLNNGSPISYITNLNKDDISIKVSKTPNSIITDLYIVDKYNLSTRIDLLSKYNESINKTYQDTAFAFYFQDSETFFIKNIDWNSFLSSDDIIVSVSTFKSGGEPSKLEKSSSLKQLINTSDINYKNIILQDGVSLSYNSLDFNNKNKLRINYKLASSNTFKKFVITSDISKLNNTDIIISDLSSIDLKEENGLFYFYVDVSDIFLKNDYIQVILYYDDHYQNFQIEDEILCIKENVSTINLIEEDTITTQELDDIITSNPVIVNNLNTLINSDLNNSSIELTDSSNISDDPVYQIEKDKAILNFDCTSGAGNIIEVVNNYSTLWDTLGLTEVNNIQYR